MGKEFIMKHVTFAAIVALAFLALPAVGSAQISFELGLGGGYVMPTGDYKGTGAEYFDGVNYGLANGFGVHAKTRLGLVGLNLTGEIGYAFLSNDGTVSSGGTVEVKHQILSLKVGPEFRFGIPAVPVTPYLGLNVALNIFSGSTTFQGVSNVSSGTKDMAGATRLGIGGTVGVKVLSFDVAVHYNLHNLTGKSWTGGDNRIDTYTSLNDDKDPAYAPLDNKHVVKDPRTIQTLAITVSYMFGI